MCFKIQLKFLISASTTYLTPYEKLNIQNISVTQKNEITFAQEIF